MVFSLNKKKRWLLPDKIRAQITDEDHDANDTDMRLTEYHKISGKHAKCVGLTSFTAKDAETGARKSKTKRKRRGYFDVSSVMDESKPSRNRNARHDRIPDNDDDDEEDEVETRVPCQLNYQVVYPSPATSYTSHSHKYINYDTGNDYWARYWRSRHCQRVKMKNSKLVQEFLADTDYDSMNDDDFYDMEDSVSYTKAIAIELNDLLDQRNLKESQNNKTLKDKRTHKHDFVPETDRRKSHIIYIEPENPKLPDPFHKNNLEPDDKSFFDLKESTPNSALEEGKRKYTIVEPAIVKLSTAEIMENDLKKKFGNRYIECNCYPRKFILDISEEVNNSGCERKANTDHTFACLTFVKDNDGDTKDLDKYLVYFNMRFDKNIDYVNLFAIYDYTVTTTTIDKLIKQAVLYVHDSNGVLVKDKRKCIRNVKQHTKTTLEHCTNWESFAYLPDLKDLFDSFVQIRENPEQAQDLGFEMVPNTEFIQTERHADEADKDKFCGICFNEIADSVPATALRSCGHWFCDCCWKEHLITCVREGRFDFVCPEYDCDQRVDRGTLLSLLDLNHVLMYLRRRHDIDVELMAVAKWCPNSSCGRVVKVSAEDVKVSSCACGKKTCFECLTDVHWPAECSVANDYRRRLRENGDDKIVPVVITEPFTANGRNCPFCRRFVEKNGGCPYMTCICSHNFCWGCGKEWDSRKHDVNCYTNGTLNSHKGTTDVVVKEEISNLARNKLISRWYKNANWYKIAVEHRTRRQLITQHKLLDSVRRLGPKLARHVSKAQRNKTPVLFEFDTPNKVYSWEAAKAGDFLKDTMALFAEIHEIIEHVAIYLDSNTNGRTDIISIRNTVNKMGVLSGVIYDMLLNGHTLDEKYVINKLKETRYRSKRCIKGLVRYFNSA